jgi:serine/threonine protein kinase
VGSPAVAKRLGRYQIVKHLASGGMADVFIANATGIEGFERYVVVKRIKQEQATNAAFVKMFLDEARLAASLHHQHIVQVHDIGQDGGEYFFTMEYIHGEDLRSMLAAVSSKKRQVPIAHVVTIMIAACGALHYAHEHRAPDRTPLNLVHRDVSPSNILVGFDGSIKVVDFGIAKAALRTDQTKSGVLKGKVAYMSPEQCRGKSLDRRSDIHALGIVLYELLTARRLFKGDSDFMTMSAIVASRIPKPSQRRPDVSAELEAITLKALAKLPEERYQTADEMRRALEQYAQKAGIPTSTSAVGDFMTDLFGNKPEPWLRDDHEPQIELTIDFDGSASGVALVPTDPFEEPVVDSQETSASPIARARHKQSTSPPVTLTSALNQLGDREGTPVSWEARARPGRAGRWIVTATIALALAGGGAFMLTRDRGDTTGVEAADQPTPSVDKPASRPELPAPSTQPDPPTQPVAPVVVDSGSGSAVADAGSGSAKPLTATPKKQVVKRPVVRPTVKKPTAKGSADWDPNSLLPE